MKKNIFRLLLLAGVVIMFSACDKDDNDLPEEAGVNNPLLRTDWVDDGLYGKVKQTVENRFDRVEWDTIAGKPVVQSKDVDNKNIVNYNSAGYRTSQEYLRNQITNAYGDGENVIISENEALISEKTIYEYDGKNRLTKEEYAYYSYQISVGGYDITNYNNYKGDTLFYLYPNSDPFVLEIVDTMLSKTETTYDDNAKLATMLDYELQADGTWKEVGKTTYTLNSEGYIDDNSTRTEYSVKTNSVNYEVSAIEYYKNDAQGNWTESYSYYYYSGQHNVYNYQTRDITYY